MPDPRRDRSEVSAAFAIFPKDIAHSPKDLAARFFNVVQWTEFSAGGHFAAMEQPGRLANDMTGHSAQPFMDLQHRSGKNLRGFLRDIVTRSGNNMLMLTGKLTGMISCSARLKWVGAAIDRH